MNSLWFHGLQKKPLKQNVAHYAEKLPRTWGVKLNPKIKNGNCLLKAIILSKLVRFIFILVGYQSRTDDCIKAL